MIIEMKNIRKQFGDLEVLKDISFGVDSGLRYSEVKRITSQIDWMCSTASGKRKTAR